MTIKYRCPNCTSPWVQLTLIGYKDATEVEHVYRCSNCRAEWVRELNGIQVRGLTIPEETP